MLFLNDFRPLGLDGEDRSEMVSPRPTSPTLFLHVPAIFFKIFGEVDKFKSRLTGNVLVLSFSCFSSFLAGYIKSADRKFGGLPIRFPDSIACQCGVDQHRGRHNHNSCGVSTRAAPQECKQTNLGNEFL